MNNFMSHPPDFSIISYNSVLHIKFDAPRSKTIRGKINNNNVDFSFCCAIFM